jgi:hypothetical protein
MVRGQNNKGNLMCRVFALMIIMFTEGCSVTLFEFEVEQFKICKGRYFCGKVAKIGLDLITGERICICRSGRRLRYVPDDFD